MAYVLGTHIKTKYLSQGLKSIFGLNYSNTVLICKKLGFNHKFLTAELSNEQIVQINDLVQSLNILVHTDLQRAIKNKIQSLSSIRTYRGMRHRQGLPCRGQRSHTNAKTQKKLKHSRKH